MEIFDVTWNDDAIAQMDVRDILQELSDANINENRFKQYAATLKDAVQAQMVLHKLDNAQSRDGQTLAKYAGKPEYDRDGLVALKEVISTRAFNALLTPKKDAPPRTLDMRAVKALAKTNPEVAEVLESASHRSDPTLTIRRK